MQTKINFNRLIDHTNLNIDATQSDIETLAREAKEFNFNSICIRPNWLKEFTPLYRCSAVTSFPKEVFQISSVDEVKAIIGNYSLEEKANEFQQAMKDRASELDPVINISQLDNVKDELSVYYDSVMTLGIAAYIKPIFSCEILSDDELEFSIAKFSEFVKESQYEGIKYCYKNSTGFIKSENPDLLKTSSVALVSKIKDHFDRYDPMETVSLKIAGGVRSLADIENYYKICGERLSHIGTSSGVSIFTP